MSTATPIRTYTRCERTVPTLDSGSSFWVACDESGQDGESLTSVQPVMSHGSVAIDDEHADAVVAELRRRLPATQLRELKFGLFDSPRAVTVLVAALQDPDLLEDRSSAFVVDKGYVAAAKVIDLVVEVDEYERGNDIYSNGEARALATDLFALGPSALAPAQFDHLLDRFVALFRMGTPGRRPRPSVDELFETLAAAVAFTRAPKVRSILERVIAGREQVEYFVTHLRGSDGLPHLQPMIPAVIETLRFWHRRIPGTVLILHDQQNLLSDEMIAELRRGMRTRWPAAMGLPTPPPVTVGAFVRGDSTAHSSIQLADLVAGAGRVAAEYAKGRRSDPVARQLSVAMQPVIAPGSLWGDARSWRTLTGRSD